MSLLPFLVNFTSASISSALPVYAATPALGLPPPAFSDLTQLIAVNILLLGASNFLWVPLANSFGRRPIILLSLLLLVFSSMWAGLATDFNNLLAARALMGAGGGPADAVAPDVVGEIFFVHQRGRAMVSLSILLRRRDKLIVLRPYTLFFLPPAPLSAPFPGATSSSSAVFDGCIGLM